MAIKFKLLFIGLFPLLTLAQTESKEGDIDGGKKKALVFMAREKRMGAISFHMVRKDEMNQLEITFEPTRAEKLTTTTEIPTMLKFEDGSELELYPIHDIGGSASSLFVGGRTVKTYFFEPVFSPGSEEVRRLSQSLITQIDIGTTEKHIIMEVPQKNAIRAKAMFAKVFR